MEKNKFVISKEKRQELNNLRDLKLRQALKERKEFKNYTKTLLKHADMFKINEEFIFEL